MSVHRLHDPGGGYEYFLRYLNPAFVVGNSIYIYNVSFEDAIRVRRELGYPVLAADPGAADDSDAPRGQ